MRQELNRKLVNHKISFVYLSANRLERFRFDVEAERLRQNKIPVYSFAKSMFEYSHVKMYYRTTLWKTTLTKAKTTHTSNTKISVHEWKHHL